MMLAMVAILHGNNLIFMCYAILRSTKKIEHIHQLVVMRKTKEEVHKRLKTTWMKITVGVMVIVADSIMSCVTDLVLIEVMKILK